MTDPSVPTSSTSVTFLPGGGGGVPEIGCKDPDGLLAAYVVIIAIILTVIIFAAVIFISALLKAVAIHK